MRRLSEATEAALPQQGLWQRSFSTNMSFRSSSSVLKSLWALVAFVLAWVFSLLTASSARSDSQCLCALCNSVASKLLSCCWTEQVWDVQSGMNLTWCKLMQFIEPLCKGLCRFYAKSFGSHSPFMMQISADLIQIVNQSSKCNFYADFL